MAYFNKRNDLMKEWKVQRTVRGESLYVDTENRTLQKDLCDSLGFFSIAAPRESTSRLGQLKRKQSDKCCKSGTAAGQLDG